MAFPNAAGVPSLAGYNPTLYSPILLKKFYDKCHLAAVANTDYQGEIKNYGDTVIMRSTPTINVSKYRKGQTLLVQRPEPTTDTLLIDQGYYWSFVTESVDKKQTDLKKFVTDWTNDAAQQIDISIEGDIWADVYGDVHAKNAGDEAGFQSGTYDLGKLTAPVGINKQNAMDYIVHCGSVLDEQNIPDEDRWMILPVWFANRLGRGDLKVASDMGDGKSQVLKGLTKLPPIDRFTIYRSNLLADVTDGSDTVTNIMFGHKCALTFAAQLTENEVLPNPNGFGTLHRGLMVYGYKVVTPKALGCLYAVPAADAA